MARDKAYNRSVFINCPFDEDYRPILRAIVFAVFDCGFAARCALEYYDASEVRLEKIFRLIRECRYGIHDISRTELDAANSLPRFNMPLELGMFLGAKRFGNASNKKKSALILDRERYRYQKFISDIAGQDIKAHDGKPDGAIRAIRDWRHTISKRVTIPGSRYIIERYAAFERDLPDMCMEPRLVDVDLTFTDHAALIARWLSSKAPGR